MKGISIRNALFALISLAAAVLAMYALSTRSLRSVETNYASQQGIAAVQGAAAAAAVNANTSTSSAIATTSAVASVPVAPAPEPASIAPTVPAAMPINAVVTANNTPVPPAPAFSVTAGEQPASSLALSGAGGVPFTNFTLTAGDQDVTVNSITVERVGMGQDGIFDSVDLTDEEGSDLGERHFDVNHKMVFAESFVVPAHSSKVLSLLANMVGDLTPFEGEMPKLQVSVIDASFPVTGALPIVGTAQKVNITLVIGGATAQMSQYDPGNDINRYIGDTNIKFGAARITANSTEDLTLSSVTWRQNGTASASDVTNVRTFVENTPYITTEEGREYTAAFSPAIVIRKGQSLDIYLTGDLLLTGAQRTLKFDIDSSADIALTGNTYGYGVGLAADSNTATTGDSVFITSDGTSEGDEGTPFYSAPIVTINGGTAVSIQKAN